MVLYNVPGRTVADMQTETVLRLAQVPGIVGIKEATGNIERACWLIKQAPKGFSIYSGDDGTAVALMLLGGQGNVSVTANVAPRAMQALCAAALAGNAREAAPPAAAADAAASRPVRRAEPRPDEMGADPARPLRPRHPPADPAAHPGRPGDSASGDAGSRPVVRKARAVSVGIFSPA